MGSFKGTFLSHFGPVSTRFLPFGPIPALGRWADKRQASKGPESSKQASKQGPRIKWPKIDQNGSNDPRIRASPDRVQRGYPRSPPDNCQLPTDNRQPPQTANRQPPTAANRQPQPTADRQPGQMGPKTVQNGNFQKWSSTLGEGQTPLCGPFCLARFQPFSAVEAHFSPVSPES